jgi:RNA polymerase sigma-70 factor (ECF subfamily)
MEVLIASMPIPVSERMPEPAVKALHSQETSPGADADAERLSAAIARGDEVAFREVYDRYHDRLFRFALVLGKGDQHLAHETVQSAFVTAAARLRRVRSEAHLWNWLARVARQQLSKAWRQQRRDSAIAGVADVPEARAANQAGPMLEENLDAALQAMAVDERQVIEWFYFDGLSHKEIGEKLSATAKAVSSRLERARAKLRSLLSKKDSDET